MKRPQIHLRDALAMDNPIPNEQARREAKNTPGGWVYAIDRNYGADPSNGVPAEAIKGAWKVDENGEITGEFIPNPNYRQLP